MTKRFFALTALMVIAFVSCKKDASDPASLQNTQNSLNKTAAAEESSPTFSVVDNGDGSYTATLQPDDTNGQDVFVAKLQGNPDYAAANINWQPELDVSAWTSGGSPLSYRSYLRFAELLKIPATAQVLSATLYLYGVNSSIGSPQGNSYYPGSPYDFYGTNRCIIEPAAGPWDESTLTWNNQPGAVTNKEHVSIPPSTSKWNYDVALTDVKGMVAKAVQYPDKNYGVRISLSNETVYRCVIFASSEWADASKHPKLVVTYE